MSSSKKNSDSPFSLDATQAGYEVPSVTRLLNRKKIMGSAPPSIPTPSAPQSSPSNNELPAFALEAPPTQSPPSQSSITLEPQLFSESPSNEEAPAVAEAPNEPTLAISLENSGIAESKPEPEIELAIELTPQKRVPTVSSKVKNTARNKTSATEFAKRFRFWKLTELEQSKDSLSHELSKLINAGANGILFLAIQPPGPGEKRPRFVSSSCVNSDEALNQSRGPLWESVSWDPQTTPEFWNKIVKEGWFEVAPPKTHVLKEVFGGKNEEALTMIRVGTAQNCSGVLIVLSAKSLKPEVTQTLLKAA